MGGSAKDPQRGFVSGGGWLLVHTEGPLRAQLAFIYQTWAFLYTPLSPFCNLFLNLVFPKVVVEQCPGLMNPSCSSHRLLYLCLGPMPSPP